MQINLDNVLFQRNEKAIFPPLNYSIEAGELIQITGCNGAGKTTLLKMLAGIYAPTKGLIIPNSFSRLYIGHETGMNGQLSAWENLSFYQQCAKVPSHEKLKQVLYELQLIKYINIPLKQLSAGQKQRVALAQLSLIPAQVWLLDEPYSHLDLNSINWLNQQMLAHREKKGIVIFTSHQKIDLPEHKYLSL